MSWSSRMQEGWTLAALANAERSASAPDAPPPPEDPRAFVARVAPTLRRRPIPRTGSGPAHALASALLGVGDAPIRRRFRPPPGLVRWLERWHDPEEAGDGPGDPPAG